MKKNILIVAGVVILATIIILWRLFANLDGIVAGIIENTGSDVLKTKVSVSGVSIDLKAGKAGIAGMTVANPAGFSKANIFELNGIEVDLNLDSIGKEVLVIESIRVDNPKIVFESIKDGGSNMQALLDNINSGSSDGKSTGQDQGEATKMIIDLFELNGGQVTATSELKPGAVIDITLPEIRMTGIGKAQGGVTADVVAKEITSKLVNAVIKEAAKKGLNRVIEEKTRGLLEKIKGNN